MHGADAFLQDANATNSGSLNSRPYPACTRAEMLINTLRRDTYLMHWLKCALWPQQLCSQVRLRHGEVATGGPKPTPDAVPEPSSTSLEPASSWASRTQRASCRQPPSWRTTPSHRPIVRQGVTRTAQSSCRGRTKPSPLTRSVVARSLRAPSQMKPRRTLKRVPVRTPTHAPAVEAALTSRGRKLPTTLGKARVAARPTPRIEARSGGRPRSCSVSASEGPAGRTTESTDQTTFVAPISARNLPRRAKRGVRDDGLRMYAQHRRVEAEGCCWTDDGFARAAWAQGLGEQRGGFCSLSLGVDYDLRPFTPAPPARLQAAFCSAQRTWPSTRARRPSRTLY